MWNSVEEANVTGVFLQCIVAGWVCWLYVACREEEGEVVCISHLSPCNCCG